MFPTIGISLKRDLICNKSVKKPLVFYSLINLDFLIRHTVQFDESIILPFFIFLTFGFILAIFFLHFKQ